MHTVTLKFPSIEILVDYLFIHPNCSTTINHDSGALTGSFTTAEIELALNGFDATLLIEVDKKVKEHKTRVYKNHYQKRNQKNI